MKACEEDVKYTIFISTISAYVGARSLYGRVKYQLEQTFLREKLRGAIVRPGLVIHEPLRGIAATMNRFVKRYPIVPLIGRGQQLIYPCALSELSQLILHLATHQPIIQRPIVASARQGMTFKKFVKHLAKRQQKMRLLLPVSFHMIYFMLKLLEKIGLSIGLRSDSLLGLQYANQQLDFSETNGLGINFSALES